MGNPHTAAMRNPDTEKATRDAQSLIGQSITSVCFAEYSCFIYLDSAHIRIESSASVGDTIKRYTLFPVVDNNSLNLVLGKRVTDVSVQAEHFIMMLCNNQTIDIEIQDDFESIDIEIGNKSVIL